MRLPTRWAESRLRSGEAGPCVLESEHGTVHVDAETMSVDHPLLMGRSARQRNARKVDDTEQPGLLVRDGGHLREAADDESWVVAGYQHL